MKILAEFMDKKSYGDYLLLISVLVGVLGITYSAFDQGFLRNINLYSTSNNLSAKYTSTLYFYSIVTVIIYVFAVFFFDELNSNVSINLFFIWLSFRWIVNFQITVANGLGERWLDAKSKILELIIKCLIIGYFVFIKSVEIYLVVLAQIISTFFQIIYLHQNQKKYVYSVSLEEIKKLIKETLKFCWPMIFWGGFGWLNIMSARWIINNNLNSELVAEYSVLYSISSMPINFLLSFITTYFLPELYKRETNVPGYARRSLIKISIYLMVCVVFITLFAFKFSSEIVEILTSKNYILHANFLPMVIFFLGLNASASLLAYDAFARKKLVRLLIPSILPGIIMAILCFYFTSSIGFEGAFYSLFISSLIGSILYIVAFKTRMN